MTDPDKDNSQLQPKRKPRGWQRTFGRLLQRARDGEDLELAADVPDQIVKQPDGRKTRRAKLNLASVFAQLEGLKERFVGIPKRLASVPKRLQRLKKLRAAGQNLQQDDVDWLIDVVEECSWLMDVVDELVVLPVRKGREPDFDLKVEQQRWLAWGRKRLRELKALYHSADVAMRIVVRELKKQRCFDNWSSSTFADRLRRKSD